MWEVGEMVELLASIDWKNAVAALTGLSALVASLLGLGKIRSEAQQIEASTLGTLVDSATKLAQSALEARREDVAWIERQLETVRGQLGVAQEEAEEQRRHRQVCEEQLATLRRELESLREEVRALGRLEGRSAHEPEA